MYAAVRIHRRKWGDAMLKQWATWWWTYTPRGIPQSQIEEPEHHALITNWWSTLDRVEYITVMVSYIWRAGTATRQQRIEEINRRLSHRDERTVSPSKYDETLASIRFQVWDLFDKQVG